MIQNNNRVPNFETPAVPQHYICAAIHTIQAGDTLYALSRKYNVTVSALMQANNIDNPYSLQIGQQICIPRQDNIPNNMQCDGIMHTIVQGDNPYLLSKHYGVSLNSILEANPNIDPHNLIIGSQLCIPGIRPVPAPSVPQMPFPTPPRVTMEMPAPPTMPETPLPPTILETPLPPTMPEIPFPTRPLPIAPAPIEPLPVVPMPFEPLPATPIPIENLPVVPMPFEPLPATPIPIENLPVVPMPVSPVENLPVVPMPFEPPPAAPTEPAPVKPAPIKSMPAEPPPQMPKPPRPVPVEPMPTRNMETIPTEPMPEPLVPRAVPMPPEPTPKSEPKSSPKPKSYTVNEGDTLYMIAKNNGVTLDELINANPDLDFYNLRVGMVLIMPSVLKNTDRASLSDTDEKGFYRVQPGDNLDRICDNFKVMPRNLMKANPHLTIVDYSMPGTKICIPR